jgi:hypothetical protein
MLLHAMNTTQLDTPLTDLDLTSTPRIVAAVLSLIQDDPWEVKGAAVLSAVEQEVAKHRVEFTDQWKESWNASECRSKIWAAEQALRSEDFRERSGLRPWGLLIATVGADALTDEKGNSPLHWAAENSAWHAIPARTLTADAILQLNERNQTAFEIAAKRHALQSMDEETLKTVASARNRAGDTALHRAARGGYLLILPQCLKSDEILAIEDAEGVSVLERHLAHLTPRLG